MDIPGYRDILNQISNSKNDVLSKSYNVTILRSITIEPIDDYLKYLGLRDKLNINITFSGFNTIIEDIISNKILENNSPDLVLIVNPAYLTKSKILYEFDSLSPSEINQDLNNAKEDQILIIREIRKRTDCPVIWLSTDTFQKASIRNIAYLNNFINCLNDLVSKEINKFNSTYILDINNLIAKIGATNFYDNRQWYKSSLPYTLDGIAQIAMEAFKFVRSFLGCRKKCLVLDCDNTLWGGIVGEVGLSGIKVGGLYPGNSYKDFQKYLKSLSDNGLILAIASKNNEEDVLEVFERHPEMILKKEHFSSLEINWNSKAISIINISKQLNIGLDSIVFADDSSYEIDLVSQEIPEVTCIKLDHKNPSHYIEKIDSMSLFENHKISFEDKNRRRMYSQDQKRLLEKKEIGNIDDYIKYLKINLTFGKATEVSIDRLAQLHEKTNQFNLTTKRFSSADLKKFTKENEYDVFSISANDRHGDLGIVGSSLVSYNYDKAKIETFLISCRALGRGIENIFLREILLTMKKNGISFVIGEYIPSNKNQQTKSFYLDNGFEKTSNENIFNLNITNYSFKFKTQLFNSIKTDKS